MFGFVPSFPHWFFHCSAKATVLCYPFLPYPSFLYAFHNYIKSMETARLLSLEFFRVSHNILHIIELSIKTLNDLYPILNCNIGDIVSYVPYENDQTIKKDMPHFHAVSPPAAKSPGIYFPGLKRHASIVLLFRLPVL